MKRTDIDVIKEKYPAGTIVELVSMENESQMPNGLRGTVEYVDDAGHVHVRWENGSGLSLLIGIDFFKVVGKE